MRQKSFWRETSRRIPKNPPAEESDRKIAATFDQTAIESAYVVWPFVADLMELCADHSARSVAGDTAGFSRGHGRTVRYLRPLRAAAGLAAMETAPGPLASSVCRFVRAN